MIPTYDDFTSQVGRGPKINRVSEALGAYWADKRNRTLEDEVGALKMLIDVGKTWIKSKDTKSEYNKNFLGQRTGNINQKLVNRRRRVAHVVEGATKELMMLLRANGLLTTDMRGEMSFDLRKFRQKAKLKLERYGTKSLAKGYQQERETWVQSGKTTAISGTLVHGFTGPDNEMGFRHNELGRARQQGILTRKIERSYDRINQSGGSSQDWRIFSQLQQVIGDPRVLYLKKSQRYKHMVFIEGGDLMAADGTPVDTTGAGNGHVWVMDQYGNLYVHPQSLGLDHEIQQVNHSTMNSGREVICAGMIHVTAGKATGISNASGHYKPTKQNLVEAVTILAEEGLDMTSLEVVSVRFPGPVPRTCYWDVYDPAAFVTSRGGAQPVREEVGPEP